MCSDTQRVAAIGQDKKTGLWFIWHGTLYLGFADTGYPPAKNPDIERIRKICNFPNHERKWPNYRKADFGQWKEATPEQKAKFASYFFSYFGGG